VVGDHTVVVGVVRGVVLDADAVVGLHAVFDGGGVEGVIAGSSGFEGAAVSAGSIDGEIADGAVGGSDHFETESAVGQTTGTGSAGVFVGDGQAVDGQIALRFKPDGRAALSAARCGTLMLLQEMWKSPRLSSAAPWTFLAVTPLTEDSATPA